MVVPDSESSSSWSVFESKYDQESCSENSTFGSKRNLLWGSHSNSSRKLYGKSFNFKHKTLGTVHEMEESKIAPSISMNSIASASVERKCIGKERERKKKKSLTRQDLIEAMQDEGEADWTLERQKRQ